MNAPERIKLAAERDQLDSIETLVRRYLDTGGELFMLLNDVADAIEETRYKSFAHKLHRLAVEAISSRGN